MPSGTGTQTAKTLIGRKNREEVPELHTRIAMRAYQLFEEGGRMQGHDLENWLQAEQEVLSDRMSADLG